MNAEDNQNSNVLEVPLRDQWATGSAYVNICLQARNVATPFGLHSALLYFILRAVENPKRM